MDEESRRKIVKILKELQLDSMGVDLATPPEDNVEYLTDKLHWAEVQIEALIASYSREARQEGFKAGQEDIINHYHHDRTIRRAIQEATLKATGKVLGGENG